MSRAPPLLRILNTFGCAFAILLSCAVCSARGAAPAADSASQSAYAADDSNNTNDNDPAKNTNGWKTGDNGGSGFGPWTLQTNARAGTAGFYVGRSSDNGGTGNIDTSGKAWGLFADQRGTALAIRSFTSGGSSSILGEGQTLSLKLDSGVIRNTGGLIGFNLLNAAGVTRFSFRLLRGGATYAFNVGNSTNIDTGIPFTTNGLTVSFLQGSLNTFQITVAPNGGSTVITHGYLSQSDITQVEIFNSNAGASPLSDLFVNSLSITTGFQVPKYALPQAIKKSNSAFDQAVTFFNVPSSTSLALSLDITLDSPSSPRDLKVTVFRGELDRNTSRPPFGVAQFLLWDHEPLINDTGQPVGHIHATAVLPQSVNGQAFAGSSIYTVQVLDDTVPQSSQVIGTFNSASLAINPVSAGHTGPPTVNLYGGTNNEPVPSQIDYGQPLTLVANAIGNPSSYKIQRLGIAITALPTPAPPKQPVVYKSNVISEPVSSTSGLTLLYSPSSSSPTPILPPGNYSIATTAIDSAGFATTVSRNLTVIRQFGLFSFAVNMSSTHVNGDNTTTFNGMLTLENHTAMDSGELRIRLLEVPTTSYTDQDGPPDLSGYPPAEPAQAFVGPVVPLPAGGMPEHVTVSGKVRAPVPNMPFESTQYINFQVFAMLDENVAGQWLPIDSLKVIDGVQFRARGFGDGPGGGVNEPPPNFRGTNSEILSLSGIDVTGPDYVIDSTQAQFLAAASAVYADGSAARNDIGVTTYSRWTASMFSITSSPTPTPAPSPLPSPTPFRTGGLFQAGHVNTDTDVRIMASFTLGAKTVSDTKLISVIQNPIRSISRRAVDGHIILSGPDQHLLQFQVQASLDLLNFTTLGPVTVNPNGTLSYEDPNPGNKRFYRLFLPTPPPTQ